MRTPIVMVHGAFCAGWAFDAFRTPFEARGYRCHAPNLPGHSPGESPAGLSMSHYAAAVAETIEAVPAPPVVIGHSMGGLVAAMAAARRKVRALVLIAPSAPWGVSGGSVEEAAQAFGLMGLGAYWANAVEPDRAMFESYSADRLSPEARRAAFERLVPESGRALFETVSWWLDPFMTTSVGPAVGSPPVLVLAGGRDQVHPPALVRRTAQRCGGELEVFPQMSHWLIGEPGYRSVADRTLAWLSSEARAAA